MFNHYSEFSFVLYNLLMENVVGEKFTELRPNLSIFFNYSKNPESVKR